jgi:hypothetical protein
VHYFDAEARGSTSILKKEKKIYDVYLACLGFLRMDLSSFFF